MTMPLGGTTTFGDWNVHGGVEFQTLGKTTTALNGGDGHQVIGSIGARLCVLRRLMLTIGMVMLALVTFAAMLGFVVLCERV